MKVSRVFLPSLLALLMNPAVPLNAAAASEPDEGVLSPRQQAIDHRMEALWDGMTRSADLRLRILYSYRTAFVDDAHIEMGTRTDVLLPVKVLDEQARGSTDPLLLDLLLARCGSGQAEDTPCDPLDIARRWTEADTQNQIAWLALATVQRERGDAAGAHATFLRAAQASAWHEHEWDVAQLIAAAAPPGLPAAEQLAWAGDALGKAFSTTMNLRVLPILTNYCKEGAGMRAACLKIASAMTRDGASLMTLIMAPNVAARAQAPESVVAAYRQTAYAVYWGVLSDPAGPVDMTAEFDDADTKVALSRMQRGVMLSERTRGERFLVDRHVSEVDAAERYNASMSAEARASRDRMLLEARAAGAVNAGSTHSTAASP